LILLILSRYKKLSLTATIVISIFVLWLFLTPIGQSLRNEMAKTIITTRYQQYAWVFVGKAKSEQLIGEAKNYAIP
jgi:hypothetical protein